MSEDTGKSMRKEIWIAPAVFAADRVCKILAERIPPGGKVLIPGILGLRYTRNTGMAFSLFSGHPWLLGLLSLLIVAGAFRFLWKKEIPPLPFIGLMLMLGGAAGNMADRLFGGSVPDMIELLFVRFAVFNPADMALTIGCAMMMLHLIFGRSQPSGSSSCK